jgi:hypothetical protein
MQEDEGGERADLGANLPAMEMSRSFDFKVGFLQDPLSS